MVCLSSSPENPRLDIITWSWGSIESHNSTHGQWYIQIHSFFWQVVKSCHFSCWFYKLPIMREGSSSMNFTFVNIWWASQYSQNHTLKSEHARYLWQLCCICENKLYKVAIRTLIPYRINTPTEGKSPNNLWRAQAIIVKLKTCSWIALIQEDFLKNTQGCYLVSFKKSSKDIFSQII